MSWSRKWWRHFPLSSRMFSETVSLQLPVFHSNIPSRLESSSQTKVGLSDNFCVWCNVGGGERLWSLNILVTEDEGFNSRRRHWWDFFSLHHRLWDTSPPPLQPPIQWVQAIKRAVREADRSPPSSAEVMNAWSYTSAPPYVFMAWYLVKSCDSFTVTFIFTIIVLILS
jgi:hypothetical protein